VSDPLDILFTPLRLRDLTLRNRFVIPGMQRGFMNDGAPTPKMIEYMRCCAAGGAGLIISESTSPDHPSAYWQPMMGRMEAGTLGAWGKVRARRFKDLALFSKTVHLAEAMAAIEPGFVEEGRKNDTAD